MFDLEREIDDWVRAVVACGSGDRADELEDHLRSEIESLMAEGVSAEVAFHEARERMGDSELLAREFAKTSSILGLLCQADRRFAQSVALKPGRLSALVIVQSLVWAAVMMAVAIVAPEHNQQLTPILLAGWFAGTFLPLSLVDPKASARAELACLRRRLSGRRAA
ncbi:MAG: permease prefix domain 1-containing protein [Gammaproteobacteria bacterium]|jgi:hypothetical protein